MCRFLLIGMLYPQRTGNGCHCRMLSVPDQSQVFGKLSRTLVTLRRIFCHHFFHDQSYILRHIRVDPVRRNQRPVKMLAGDFNGIGAFIRETPGQQMVEGRAQTVYVGPVVQRIAGKLFGTYVLRSAHDLIPVIDSGVVADFCQP